MLLTAETLPGWVLRHLDGDAPAVLGTFPGTGRGLAAETLPDEIDVARRQVRLAEQWEHDHRNEPLVRPPG